MGVIDLKDLTPNLLPEQRLLGLDLGTKTIGLALSDVSRTIATPLTSMKRDKFTKNATELCDILEKFFIGAIVIGLPMEMDGLEGKSCQSARQFARNLLTFKDIHIVFYDERLSTVAVTKTLLEADVSRRKRSLVVDKLAAAYILQGALNRMNSKTLL
jgi:putative Holliday junction resolvase